MSHPTGHVTPYRPRHTLPADHLDRRLFMRNVLNFSVPLIVFIMMCLNSRSYQQLFFFFSFFIPLMCFYLFQTLGSQLCFRSFYVDGYLAYTDASSLCKCILCRRILFCANALYLCRFVLVYVNMSVCVHASSPM